MKSSTKTCLSRAVLGQEQRETYVHVTTEMLIYKPKLWKAALGFYVSSLWGNTFPPPPRPLHVHLPADVIPGCGHVLHRPPAPAASVRGAGGRFGCLPAAHETASVGLLDMADHAVTETDHRWRHRAYFIFSRPLFFSVLERSQGPQTPQPFGKALYTACSTEPFSQWKTGKMFSPRNMWLPYLFAYMY